MIIKINMNNQKYIFAFIIITGIVFLKIFNKDGECSRPAIFRIIFELFIGCCLEFWSQSPICNYYMVKIVILILFITVFRMVFCCYRPCITSRNIQSIINIYSGRGFLKLFK